MVKVTTSDYLDVSKLIKQIRLKKKISQERLGQKIGVTGKTVSAYELGRINPTLDNFIKILHLGGLVLDIKEDIYKTPKKLTIPLS